MITYGIDIGGTKIETAIFNSEFEKLDSWRIATPTQNYSLFIDTIAEQIQKADHILSNKFNFENIVIEKIPVGIGMPGLIDRHNRSLSANVPCANGKKVQMDVRQKTNRNVAIENDCRCFALSEAASGAGADYERVYGAIIGTGAAGGLCINGQIDSGHNGIMGEYGHISLPAFLQQKYNLNNIICGCGLLGCMEYFVAGPGLKSLYAHFHNESLETKDIASLVEAKDKKALHVFNCYMDLLGYTFASIVHSHDPDIIVVGGGLSKVDAILHALPNAISPYVFKGAQVPIIERAKFGDASGGRGAAILAAQSF